MSFGFKSIEHAIAATGRDIVVGAAAVAKVTGKISAAEPAIEGITGVVDPPAVIVERAAFAALGILTKAANDTSAAAAAKGVNVTLDQQTLKDFQQVYQMVVADLAGKAAVGSTAPVAATPASAS